MSTKSQLRREQLRERLIEAAEIRIDRDGLSDLRARDLAKDAGCALGAIYNVFEDLNAIAMAVNGRTFRLLGQAVGTSFDGGEPPVQRLIVMSTAYLHFADSNTNLWRALFDLKMTDDGPVPDWYRNALKGLFSYIAEPVEQLFPDLDRAEMDLMTRALFSSVHGIVTLGLENRISGVPPEQIERMITQVLSRIGNK
ncbi:TetR/AcrR family transcriptional regulator [Rhodobacteraceae bacterium B1Z28]|uniref:TetR/AcrR family transcriptional regulator n=1 Tax=Ruegeria haliotis TaxID=2747601 RepID=A0ABX2PUZ1_9RHOB|nr:TetR/AcrR family transcriptional regulator [Ruegeria haliotis]NVO57186.1 TetR/AcrR family transcriptional regulator [Ruegeria haliotis]